MFLDELGSNLREEEFNVLSRSGIGSYEELYGMLLQFPSIARDTAISLPNLSQIAASRVTANTTRTLRARAHNPVRFSKGAFSPPKSFAGNGYQQPQPVGPATPAGVPAAAIAHPLPTPVQDQGARGTCVAQAVVACAEWYFSHHDLSEQFKYWAAKRHGGDSFPDEEGTWLRCARNALTSHGVCEDSLWIYDPNPIPGNETHEIAGTEPSTAALQDATMRQHNAATYADTAAAKNGKAAMLSQELNHGPVAIALPVFVDLMTGIDNWGWTGASDYGHVLDPLQFSMVDGGHAVCVCGYEPSATAPGGGWFIFKNSWGTLHWNDGTSPAPGGHPSCPPGYGYVSASYVDEYLWELLRL